MKVAHFSMFSPNQCGLYHTAKDMVMAERSAGVDARMIAFNDTYQGIKQDGSFATEDIQWAYQADILVRHSAIPTHIQSSGIPTVMALHGRPESSFRLEQKENNPILTAVSNKTKDCRYKGFITFWPEYMDVWSYIVPEDKLFYVPSTVDLDAFSPNNAKYDFGGSCNILVADLWREDVTPFNVLIAAARFAKRYNGKVNIIGLPENASSAMYSILSGMKSDGVLGMVAGQMKDIEKYYTGSDIVATPHVIATRIVRETLASGTRLVAGSGCKYTKYAANPMDIYAFEKAIESCWLDKDQNPREVAEREFSLASAGVHARRVFEKILDRPKQGRKVFIDVGGHLGESVRRFYREVEDADKYDIYSFEPDMKTFTELDKNIGHIKNVNIINACCGSQDGMVDFYVGSDNQNEGGTLLKGKKTGGVNYLKPVKVESVNFVRWLKSNINEGDEVILKMNIEGGEYDLMELLLDNDLTGLFAKIHIQLHSHKFKHGEDRFRFNQIEERFYKESKCRNLFLTNKGVYSFNA